MYPPPPVVLLGAKWRVHTDLLRLPCPSWGGGGAHLINTKILLRLTVLS